MKSNNVLNETKDLTTVNIRILNQFWIRHSTQEKLCSSNFEDKDFWFLFGCSELKSTRLHLKDPIASQSAPTKNTIHLFVISFKLHIHLTCYYNEGG